MDVIHIPEPQDPPKLGARRLVTGILRYCYDRLHTYTTGRTTLLTPPQAVDLFAVLTKIRLLPKAEMRQERPGFPLNRGQEERMQKTRRILDKTYRSTAGPQLTIRALLDLYCENPAGARDQVRNGRAAA